MRVMAAAGRAAAGCALAVAVFAVTAHAQILFEPETLTVDVDAQHACTVDVTVTNAGKHDANVSVELEYKQPGPCQIPLAQWATASPGRLRLASEGSQTVRLTFRNSPVAPGECVLALFIGEETKGQVPLKVRTGMPVYVRLNHETRADGIIEKLDHSLLANGDLRLALTVRNQGKLHLMPFGLAWIENASGSRLWQVELKPNEPIFPDEQRVIAWQGPLPVAGRGGRTLHVQMFWGTLYDFAQVGQPKSAAVRLALNGKGGRP